MEGVYTLIAFVIGFLIAQLSKLVVAVIKKRGKISWKEGWEWMVKSGGMPSGHSASFTAATVYLGCSQGFTSPIFALAVCMTIIIVYDAVNVRYAVGEQGKLLEELTRGKEVKNRISRVVEGHTVPQVIVGILIGVVIGVVIFGIFG